MPAPKKNVSSFSDSSPGTGEMERLLEELREANERLVIAGVRLQNTNQELEASREELRSANKELNTLNEELRIEDGGLVGATGFEPVSPCAQGFAARRPNSLAGIAPTIP